MCGLLFPGFLPFRIREGNLTVYYAPFLWGSHSTVTLLARFLGLSTSRPNSTAI